MRHRQVRLIKRIDVTGLLVIVFVLLVAVMVEKSWPIHGRGPDLPKASHATKMPGANREDALLVGVARDGKIFFGSDQVTTEQLPMRIREQVGKGSPQKAYIRADARVRYGTVLEVLRAVRLGGVQYVAFIVEERKQ